MEAVIVVPVDPVERDLLDVRDRLEWADTEGLSFEDVTVVSARRNMTSP